MKSFYLTSLVSSDQIENVVAWGVYIAPSEIISLGIFALGITPPVPV